MREEYVHTVEFCTVQKKKVTTTTQKNIESQNHSVEWKKSTKEYKLYDSIYVKFKLYLMMPA